MFATTRGTLVPARKRLLALTLAVMASAPFAACADDGLVDVRTLPQLEGAVTLRAASARAEVSLSYGVPTAVPITTAATRKLLAANGWQEFQLPGSAQPPDVVQKGQSRV